MTSLRQRLLLVAGWAVAAVATGLVSAGAVAVAGGQVTDRPLQPLSAAEVAALPVTIEDPCVTSEPLASGGSASSATCPDRVSSDGPFAPGDVAARPAEKEESNQVALAPIDVPSRRRRMMPRSTRASPRTQRSRPLDPSRPVICFVVP